MNPDEQFHFDLWEQDMLEDVGEIRLEAQCPTCELWFWADGEGGVIPHILQWHKESDKGQEITKLIGETYA